MVLSSLLALLYWSHCLLCLSLLQGPSPSVCDSLPSMVRGLPIGPSPFSFPMYLRVLLRLFVKLWSAVSCFSFLALCPGSSPFLPLFAWVRSVLSIGGCRSLPLLIPAFSFGLFFVSLVSPLVLLVSPLDLSLACSFLVPHSSSFLFLSTWCSLFLRARSYPEHPLSGVSRRCS